MQQKVKILSLPSARILLVFPINVFRKLVPFRLFFEGVLDTTF